MAELTVCMNVYNGAETLRTSIGSVLKQTYQDFTILVYDDGSTDNTVEVLRSFHDDRMRIVMGGGNHGSFYARMKMIPMIDTKYFVWLDDDDCFCRDDALEYMVRTIKSGDYDFVNFSTYQCVTPDGVTKTISTREPRDYTSFDGKLFENYYPVPNKNVFWSKIFKTEFFMKSVPDQSVLDYDFIAEDLFFSPIWYYISKRYYNMETNEPLYCYHRGIGVWGSKEKDESVQRFSDVCKMRHYSLLFSYKKMCTFRKPSPKEVMCLVNGEYLFILIDWIRKIWEKDGEEKARAYVDEWRKWFGGDGRHLLTGFNDAFNMPVYVFALENNMKPKEK